jgi:hypothetical protein
MFGDVSKERVTFATALQCTADASRACFHWAFNLCDGDKDVDESE